MLGIPVMFHSFHTRPRPRPRPTLDLASVIWASEHSTQLVDPKLTVPVQLVAPQPICSSTHIQIYKRVGWAPKKPSSKICQESDILGIWDMHSVCFICGRFLTMLLQKCARARNISKIQNWKMSWLSPLFVTNIVSHVHLYNMGFCCK